MNGIKLLADLVREANPCDKLPDDVLELLVDCRHNFIDRHYRLADQAANGDVPAIAELRTMIGLPVIR